MGELVGFKANILIKNKEGKTVNTGIQVQSGVMRVDGKLVNDETYFSTEYKKQATAAEAASKPKPKSN